MKTKTSPKRILNMLLILMMVITLLPTTAFAAVGDTFTVDGLDYQVVTEPTESEAGTVKLIGRSSDPTTISVDTVQNGESSYDVTEVGRQAFDMCLQLVSVYLPKATTIGKDAFFNCSSLESIDLPEATTIGKDAFGNCSLLASVSLPKVTTIVEYAFCLCSKLTNIELPEAETIGNYAFANCSSLASITILQTTAPSLGADAFMNVPLDNCTIYRPYDATGYTTENGWPSNQVSMWPVRGTVYDEDGNPAADITVSADGHDFTTAADGSYAAYVMPGFTGDVTTTLNEEGKSISLSDVSAELSGNDFIFGTVATPTFKSSETVLVDGQSVTIDCGTLGATIRYTTDGTEPTATSDEYTGEISLTDTATVKAKAFKTGLADSETAEASYTLVFSVTLPSGTGYTVAAEATSTSPTAKGGDYSFTLSIDSNYEKGASFAVKANGAVLTPSGDIYTIENITSAQTVTVEGVVMKHVGSSTPSTYTLTFNTNGGSAISNISKSGGATVDLTTYKPTETDYDFDGWYSDSDLTTKVTSIKLTKNTTVYAKWTAKTVMPFVDVPEDAYYKDAVIWAVDEGITEGTTATTFSPDDICTRAQAAAFLWRVNGSPAPKNKEMPFNDVPVGSYYYDAVLWAVEQGIIKGTSEITFSPDMNCSRAHIVTMLWRMEGSKTATAANPFADVSGSAYYADAVLWAVDEKITVGTSATTFSPDDNCTRAQIVTFIYRDMK